MKSKLRSKRTNTIYPDVRAGGIAISLGDNMYYMKGRTHEQGGIDIGKDLEVEDGEVMKLTDKYTKVFSSLPILGGNSPAKLVMRGLNPTDVFNAQEEFKDKNNINDDGTMKAKCGTRKKAELGATITSDIDRFNDSTIETNRKNKINNGTDYTNLILNGISGVSDLIGSTSSYFVNKKMLNSLEEPEVPIAIVSRKLPTTYNINPQLDEIREYAALAREDIDNNTASSKVALARKQRIRNQELQAKNQLYGQKENIENQMLTRDILNQQEINSQNINRYNDYRDKVTAFRNQVRDLKGENTTAYIQNLSDIIGGFASTLLENNKYANNLAALQLANPNAAKVLDSELSDDLSRRAGKISFKRRYRN